MAAIQDNLPNRMGGILLLNAPWYVRMLTTLMKPPLKSKMRKRIHVCSVSDLHQFFTPEQLPTRYGGQFDLTQNWIEELVERRTTLSEGLFLDPSALSEEALRSTTGDEPIRTVADISADLKKKSKGSKNKKGKTAELDSSAEE